MGEKPSLKFIYKCLDDVWVKEGFTSKNHEKKFYEKGKLYLSGFLKDGFNPKVLPVVVEQQFTVPLGELRIGGRLDRVDVLPDGTIEIIDYKTGATIPTQKEVDKNLQLSFYALAATSIPQPPFGRVPEKVRLSLYFLDGQEKLSTVRTKEDLENAKKETLKVKGEIEKSNFACSGNFLCERCEYSLFCRTR